MCYQVIIVEDDPMVASINKKYTESVPGFRVTGIFKNGEEGLKYLRKNKVDLVILDYYMPEMNGDVFMDRIREEGIQVSVIMVTSANSAETVRSLLLKGVRDYLIKPFEMERFQAALERFRSNRELLSGAESGIGQSELDRLFAGNAGSLSPDSPSAELPKGLNDKTLEMVRGKMKENAGKKLTSEEIAAMVGLSRITVRRYLGYLEDRGELASEIDYRTGGRPGVLYRYL
ncbi:MAG: response regulator [Stomatobaculum sp.]|nr:response regulator [Stomatobaculum sp.]